MLVLDCAELCNKFSHNALSIASITLTARRINYLQHMIYLCCCCCLQLWDTTAAASKRTNEHDIFEIGNCILMEFAFCQRALAESEKFVNGNEQRSFLDCLGCNKMCLGCSFKAQSLDSPAYKNGSILTSIKIGNSSLTNLSPPAFVQLKSLRQLA